jgi:biotin transport system substrate-specific component
MAGILLGRWWGGISMALYAGLGIAGVPWFNGWAGGIAHVAGPTGGYIIGFILAALLTGHFSDKYFTTRHLLPMVGLMLAADFILIYVPGLLQLHLWMNLVTGKSMTLGQTLSLGLVPFIAGDIIKAAIAGGIGWAILPKARKNY